MPPYLASVELAPGKARTAALFEKPRQALEDAINHGGVAAVTAQALDVADEGDLVGSGFRRRQEEVLHGSDDDRRRASAADRAGRLLHRPARLYISEVDERPCSSPICEELSRFRSYHSKPLALLH